MQIYSHPNIGSVFLGKLVTAKTISFIVTLAGG